MPPRRIWAYLLGAAVVSGGYALWALGTSSRTDSSVPRSGLSFEPTQEQRAAMHALRSGLSKDNPRFAVEDARQKSNAKLFTHMAATSEEPHVVRAALEAIQSAYSSRSARKQAPDADLDRALVKHLRSERADIASAAFEATRIPLMSEQPGSELISNLVKLAGPSEPAPRRHAALEALNLLRPDKRSSGVLECFELALSAEQPHSVSAALFALAQSGASFEAIGAQRSKTLGRTVFSLAKHVDPGVRGRAFALLRELEWLVEPARRYTKAKELLEDPHAYVRAEAVAVVAHARRAPAIHRLMVLVDDLSIAEYELIGWTALDGTPGRLSHRLSGRKRVAEAALYAIRSLSSDPETSSDVDAGTPSDAQPWSALSLTLGGRGQDEGKVRENAELAKSWYRLASTQIPLEASITN